MASVVLSGVLSNRTGAPVCWVMFLMSRTHIPKPDVFALMPPIKGFLNLGPFEPCILPRGQKNTAILVRIFNAHLLLDVFFNRLRCPFSIGLVGQARVCHFFSDGPF